MPIILPGRAPTPPCPTRPNECRCQLCKGELSLVEGGRVGQGAQGEVVQVLQGRGATKRRMALKRIPGGAERVSAALERARGTNYSHPHIMPYICAFRHTEINSEQTANILMPLMEGDLGGIQARAVAESGTGRSPTPPDEVAKVVYQIASALHHLHTIRTQHGDVKPSNILRGNTPQGNMYRLSDLELCTRMLPEETHLSGAQGYSYDFAALEQMWGRGRLESDMWSLGCVMHTLLVGYPPGRPYVSGIEQGEDALHASLSDTLPAGVPSLMIETMLGMTRVDPTLRMGAGEVVLALSEPTSIYTSPSEPQPEVDPEARLCRLCFDLPRCVRLPCGHCTTCAACYTALLSRPRPACPTCRAGLDRSSPLVQFLQPGGLPPPTYIPPAAAPPDRRHQPGRGPPPLFLPHFVDNLPRPTMGWVGNTFRDLVSPSRAPLPPTRTNWVGVDASSGASHTELQSQLAPIPHLDLRGLDDEITQRGPWSFPPRLVGLKLDQSSLGAVGIGILARALPSTLQVLDLQYNLIGDAGAAALAPHLPPGLVTLRLGGTMVGAAGLAALGPHLPPSLKELDCRWNFMGEAGITALAPMIPAGLTVLKLEENSLGPGSAATLAAQFPRLTSLVALHLAKNPLGDQGAALLGAHMPVSVSLVDIGTTGITSLGALALNLQPGASLHGVTPT